MARIAFVLFLIIGLPQCFHGIPSERRLKFQVLHNWEDVYDSSVKVFPETLVSQMILQTFGISQSYLWKGVSVGNAFRRPKASVLFVLDGELGTTGLDSKAAISYQSESSSSNLVPAVMKDGLKLVKTLEDVFEEKSNSVLLSADSKHTLVGKDLKSTAKILKSKNLREMREFINSKYCPKFVCMDKDGSFKLASSDAVSFDPSNEEDDALLREILMALGLTSDLSESAVEDSYPDVYVITFTSPELMIKRRGLESTKVHAVEEALVDVIQKVSVEFVNLYKNRVLVQAISSASGLKPHDAEPKSSVLYRRSRRSTATDEEYLGADDNNGQLSPPEDAKNLVGERSENFSAITAIITFVTVVMIISLFAVSWILYSADPAKDTIIYRLVPTRQKTE